ncbi:glycoprotein X [Hirsutella rhossiliensis]|uniref:Glycoprotein X n=1 Tax=Hirsutella rhossiliensis TaxID=111463 RepID=A0A9P8N6G1_9HYPO|nr:glycoprotein X [Hirsutella rhossiliensis]KAH0966659.1 glycoprotein X [Hirsutella rhossiliensis]
MLHVDVARHHVSRLSTTFYETETVTIAVTQHDVSTKLEYEPDLVTGTTASTFETPYPVTVTTTKNCVPKPVDGARPTPVESAGYGYGPPDVGDDQYCDTITATEWKTVTATNAVTVVQPSVVTETVLVPTVSVVPTTIEDTRTVTVTAPGEATTITLPGEIYTLPEKTVVLPGSITVSTLTREIPATTITVTEDGQTFITTLPGSTVTLPGETINLPGETRTLPAETVVLPGSTSVSTLTKELPGTTVTVVEGGTTFTVSLPTQVLPGETITVTQNGRTFTTSLPGQTVINTVTDQLPGETITVLPGQTITVTQGGSTLVRTLPGETVVSTVTEELPGQTVTVTQGGSTFTTSLPGRTVTLTESGKTLTTTLPGKTLTLTQGGTTIRTTLSGATAVIPTTVVLAPSSVPAPAGTTVTKTVQDISVCPSPTGSSAPLSPDSDLTFGCKPGYVCSPPKPDGCNVWPGPPSDDFLCSPQDCISSPPIRNVTWEDGESSYFPLSEGYFNLNPEAFGLSYDIFTFEVYEEVEYGYTRTITTGNWGSQTSLSDWPRTTATSTRAKNVYPLPPSSRRGRRALHRLGKRATTPHVCFDQCNDAWLIGGSVGKSDKLCKKGSSFRSGYDACAECVTANSDASKNTIREYVGPVFSQYFKYCSGHEATPVRLATAPVAESVVTAQPLVKISSQAETSQASFVPMESLATSISVGTKILLGRTADRLANEIRALCNRNDVQAVVADKREWQRREWQRKRQQRRWQRRKRCNGHQC